MAGGLLQLVSYGIQNKYLTKNPEITFFKIAYKRHTHFGKETISVNYDQQVEFSKKLSLTIPNKGDILSNIILHFNFASLYPNIDTIKSTIFILHQNKINILKEELSFLKSQRENLKVYSNLIFGGIKIIEKYQETLNISLNLFNTLLSSYQLKIKDEFNAVKDLINPDILEKSNIFTIILNNDLFTSIQDLIDKKNTIKNYLTLQNTIINKRIINKQNQITSHESYPIKYNFKKHLANFLINQIEIEIDGEFIDRITHEQLEIYFQHHYDYDQKQNLNKIINGDEFNDFELFLPINFWIKQSYGLGIPLVAMRFSTVKLNISLNDIENLIDFFDFEKEYNDLLTFEYYKEEVTYEIDNNIVKIDCNIFSLETTNYDYYSNTVSLKTSYIYKNNLKNHLDLDDDNINTILETFGTNKNYEGLSLNQSEFKNFISNINTLDFDIPKINYYSNRFNLLNTYTLENANVYLEYIFLDQIEREKFASSRLNYIIKLHSTNSFEFNEKYFNTNLDIENYITDIFWSLQYKNDITGSNIASPDYHKLIEPSKIDNFQLMLEQYSTFHKLNTAQYFNYVIPNQYLNSAFDNNYFYYSFSLYPEDNQPSGGANFGDMGGKQFIINLKEDTDISSSNPIILKIFYRKISILTVHKGKAKLAFFNKK